MSEWRLTFRDGKLPDCPCQEHIDTYEHLREALAHFPEEA